MPGVTRWQVEPAEAGQKLLQFLTRRFQRDIPAAALQRWIRTGQVRVNSARAKPDTRLETGQEIRIPPHERDQPPPLSRTAPDLTILLETEDLLILSKPAGLPVHPGSGHADSISTRLKALFPMSSWPPTPAHRLDRDTTGLLAVAKTYAFLRRLHEFWRTGQVRKTYLAWVQGRAGWDEPTRITDLAAKTRVGNREKMVVGQGQELVSWILTIARQNNASLALIVPQTGRTHQIRVQMAARNRPLLGDRKYGGPASMSGMLLHAWHLAWPGFEHALPPSWPHPWKVTEVIDERSLRESTRLLASQCHPLPDALDAFPGQRRQ